MPHATAAAARAEQHHPGTNIIDRGASSSALPGTRLQGARWMLVLRSQQLCTPWQHDQKQQKQYQQAPPAWVGAPGRQADAGVKVRQRLLRMNAHTRDELACSNHETRLECASALRRCAPITPSHCRMRLQSTSQPSRPAAAPAASGSCHGRPRPSPTGPAPTMHPRSSSAQ